MVMTVDDIVKEICNGVSENRASELADYLAKQTPRFQQLVILALAIETNS